MRLPEIFGLSTFPVFWTFQTFGLRNKSGVIPLFLNVQNFRETYRKSYWKTKIYQKMLKMLKMLKIYRNFQKSTVYVKSRRYIFDILVICLKKCSKRRPQKAWKWPKFDQKYQKLYRIFEIFDCQHIFGLSVHVKSVPKNSSFYFHESRYIFGKMYRSSKLLPEPMALQMTPHPTPFVNN